MATPGELYAEQAVDVDVHEPWADVTAELRLHPHSFHAWTKLFDAFDAHTASATPSLKQSVNHAYTKLLTMHPLLTDAWKRFARIQLQLNGPDAFLETLNDAVSANPYSIDLWLEYLSALQAQNSENPVKTPVATLHHQYSVCFNHIGRHYNAGPIYDKYLEFLQPIELTKKVFDTYKKLIALPLYNYAQYYQKFTEINKDFDLFDVLEQLQIDEYAAGFNKKADELTLVEKHHIIDDFSYKTFARTQQVVNEKWTYESELPAQEFSLAPDSHDASTEPWEKYIDHEISNPDSSYDDVVQLFDRALLPCCHLTEIWMKYVAYVQKDPAKVKSVYERAIRLVPLTKNSIRRSYADFLATESIQTASEYLLDLIRLFSGKNLLQLYVKNCYLEFTAYLIELWSTFDQFPDVILEIVQNYFGRVDRYKPDSKEKKEPTGTDLKAFSGALQNLLNDLSICILVHRYLLVLQLNNNTEKIRDFFNKHHHEHAFQTSTLFWAFFVDFEGNLHHYKNLSQIIKYIKTNTQLPKQAIDSLVLKNYDIVAANYPDVTHELGAPDDSLVSLHNDTYNSISINKAARERISANNFLVKESKKHRNVVNLAAKHADHPGIFAEAVPTVTNTLVRDQWVSLDEVPPLPTFKNVEKASMVLKKD